MAQFAKPMFSVGRYLTLNVKNIIKVVLQLKGFMFAHTVLQHMSQKTTTQK